MSYGVEIKPNDFVLKTFDGRKTEWYELKNGYLFQSDLSKIPKWNAWNIPVSSVRKLLKKKKYSVKLSKSPDTDSLSLRMYQSEGVGKNKPHWEIYYK